MAQRTLPTARAALAALAAAAAPALASSSIVRPLELGLKQHQNQNRNRNLNQKLQPALVMLFLLAAEFLLKPHHPAARNSMQSSAKRSAKKPQPTTPANRNPTNPSRL